jgi:hypothetical protein
MKLIINPKQLTLLTSNFQLIEGCGFRDKNSKLIKESRLREFVVRIIIQGIVAELRIGAYSSSSAFSLAKMLFPKAIVTSSIT